METYNMRLREYRIQRRLKTRVEGYTIPLQIDCEINVIKQMMWGNFWRSMKQIAYVTGTNMKHVETWNIYPHLTPEDKDPEIGYKPNMKNTKNREIRRNSIWDMRTVSIHEICRDRHHKKLKKLKIWEYMRVNIIWLLFHNTNMHHLWITPRATKYHVWYL